MNVLLGYEVVTGKPVEIPVLHTVITGQTQQAGKTTALEALITRSRLRAITFITKRGEGSFVDARQVPPYFSEQADWKYVAAILEASRGEKLKFERSWIIRASKGARTLADVQRNVRAAMKTAKGLSADVYLTLDAYLDDVVPQIARVRWAQSIALDAGVNAMDLTGISGDMQHLVIRSTLEWVLEREEDTVVVVPEAWKFIPEGRGTPVKLAAESFIRQSAALKNYLWLDSQDITGVQKLILKSVPLWILGVQRESNEIKHTLNNIPAGIAKPKAEAIATLGLGQFFACWEKHVIKTYVQPSWLSADVARSIAIGTRKVQRAPSRARAKEHTVDEAEARALRNENDQLRRENGELRRRLEALERKDQTDGTDQVPRGHARAASESRAQRAAHHPDAGAPDSQAVRTGAGAARPAQSFAEDDEARYQAFKARLISELPQEPTVLAILTSRPEIEVRVQRHVLEIDGDTLRGRIARLIADDFFSQARTSAKVLDELLRRGADRPSNIELGNEMKALCDMGFFTRDNKWYTLVPGMHARIVEKEFA